MNNDEDLKKGIRVENIANWYFRLNGFLSIPSCIIHLDKNEAGRVRAGDNRIAKTEADLIGVRFQGSNEKIDFKGKLSDDTCLLGIDDLPESTIALFILVEVKSGVCRMNGPWSKRENKNMQRVIRRLGFSPDDEVETVAIAMYTNGKWKDEKFVFQYICVGGRKSPELTESYPDLIQIDWDDIGKFLCKRFTQASDEKIPSGKIHEQWPDFGQKYGRWFVNNRQRSEETSVCAVKNYIESGQLITRNVR